MNIGAQIKKYRTDLELSQDELSRKIFVSRQTISNWENDKNYPDVKSLQLLSCLFGVSLDILIKGDLEEMKEKIETHDTVGYKHDRKIFVMLVILTILLAYPLGYYLRYIGIAILVLLSIVMMCYAVRVEKYKKKFDIHTYKEIAVFLEGKSLDECEKNQEIGKRQYQEILFIIGSTLLTVAGVIIVGFVFNLVRKLF